MGKRTPCGREFIIPGAFGAAGLYAATIASAAALQKGFGAEIARHARTMLDETTKSLTILASTKSLGLSPKVRLVVTLIKSALIELAKQIEQKLTAGLGEIVVCMKS